MSVPSLELFLASGSQSPLPALSYLLAVLKLSGSQLSSQPTHKKTPSPLASGPRLPDLTQALGLCNNQALPLSI